MFCVTWYKLALRWEMGALVANRLGRPRHAIYGSRFLQSAMKYLIPAKLPKRIPRIPQRIPINSYRRSIKIFPNYRILADLLTCFKTPIRPLSELFQNRLFRSVPKILKTHLGSRKLSIWLDYGSNWHAWLGPLLVSRINLPDISPKQICSASLFGVWKDFAIFFASFFCSGQLVL